ncbi:MAG TPA: proton-conducting transporter membrane subunit, partial [Chloroflexota bacterium]|nr:proton-conducting transporter membrane subunit [Chloroflexota bacterium]
MPALLVGLWLCLSLVLLVAALVANGLQRLRWVLFAAVLLAFATCLVLAWGADVQPTPHWRSGWTFDGVAHLLLPPLWAGMAVVLIAALFLPGGRYEPAIAALSTTAATAGIVSANPLFTVAMLQAGTLIILASLFVHDQGMVAHPLLNVATGLKYVTLTIVSAACLIMALLLANFYALNADRIELPRIIAALFVIGFGLLVGAVPFYFHVPDLFDAAPPLATVSLVGPLQCLAFVYLVRTAANDPWLLADQHVDDVLVAGALLGALLAAVLAFGQQRLNRLLAYNAIREVSWMVFGIALASRAGWAGALIFLAVRCVTQPLLLVIAHLAQTRAGQPDITKLGGLGRVLPLATFSWCVAVLASVGLPPVAGFWGLE